MLFCNIALCTVSRGRPTQSVKNAPRSPCLSSHSKNLCFRFNVIESSESTANLCRGKKKLQPSDFMEIINYMTNMESANASAKEILVCRQLLLQHNLKTCCLKLREIARHIWWRESVLFPPSKEEGEKRKCVHYQVKICSHFHC